MDCGSVTSADGSATTTVTAVTASHDGFDCGCGGSCHAPSPAMAEVATLHFPLPRLERGAMSEPASISRSPLLPPPEPASL